MTQTRDSSAPTALLPSGYWHELATTDFARIDPQRTIAVLPVSATEQHGPHLPLCTDAAINEGILQAALARLPKEASVLVLPALTIGDSLEHTAFPGTLSADMQDLLGLWLAVGRSVARAGVRKLVFFNSHGGQKAHVDQAALRLRVECGMLTVRAHSFGLGMPPDLFDADELAHGIHGGAVETSLMLYLRPELVRREAMADFDSMGRRLAERAGMLGAEKPVGIGWMTQDLNPAGVCGNATAASAEKGAALVEHAAGRLVALLEEVAAFELAKA
ncbi:MAG: creatininase family protein [Methylibium sp.]|uniref:creatininase family protein n=1 Tax=Methylibium sp. TaxID=2067992 RepID=UPI00185550AF|nr:creatininase family protein [Methylibium sp.]MBA3598425.1 creatininase family protein [Methylibium sp.]